MVYGSSNIALACLETVAHLNFNRLPLNRFLVEISIPLRIWKDGVTFLPALNVGWNATPAGRVSLTAGENWANTQQSLVMKVPSVLVPEEHNVLINPRHPDLHALSVRKVRQWIYDPRLMSD